MLHETKIKLSFKNKKFKLLVISDLHCVLDFDKRILADINTLLDKTRPDLVIINGDLVWKNGCENEENFRSVVKGVTAPFEERKIPWAYCFGNHDDERSFHRSLMQPIYEEFDHCISYAGEKDVDGAANFVLPVWSEDGEKIKFNIWGLDSHDSLSDYVKQYNLNPDMWFYKFDDPLHPGGNYDTIKFTQIMWYWQKSLEIEKAMGEKVPGLMCFHIPLPEFITLYRNVAQTKYKGTRREGVGCSLFNSGLFNAIVQRGDVKTVICGHDHINDFEGSLCSVTLAMDGGISYDGYCDDDLRGGRVVEINEDDPFNIKTYMVRVND